MMVPDTLVLKMLDDSLYPMQGIQVGYYFVGLAHNIIESAGLQDVTGKFVLYVVEPASSGHHLMIGTIASFNTALLVADELSRFGGVPNANDKDNIGEHIGMDLVHWANALPKHGMDYRRWVSEGRPG